MKTIFQRFKSALRAFRQVPQRTTNNPQRTRSYAAAASNRLTQDWSTFGGNANSEIRYDIETLMERSRDLERRSSLMMRYLNTLEKNVLKSGVGFALQSKAAFSNGRPDLTARKLIEEAWREWTRPKNCSQTGEASLYEMTRLTLRSAARDGGYLIRPVIDPGVNAFGFTLGTLEIDYLDANMNEMLGNGNKVVMGVEKNRKYKTVAYHLLTEHPQDMMFGGRVYKRIRVPAEEIIHYFVKQRDGQCRGVPWAAPSMLAMNHLEHYIESEIIASRAAANKGGYFTPGDDGEAPYAGENEQTVGETGVEKTGAILGDSEPGQNDVLPKGANFIPYDPTHPTQQFGDFVRDTELQICAGMDMSYATLVGDLTKASFSSMRTGALDERETFKKMQAHMIEHLMVPIFEMWLATAITNGAIALPMSRWSQISRAAFRGRRWDWVDPEKDLQAKKLEIELRLRTRDSIIDESDSELDLEETLTQIAYEEELAEELGVELAIEEKPAAVRPSEPEPAATGNGSNNGNGRKIVVARG